MIRAFVKNSKKKGNRKSTYTNDLNIALRMAFFYKKDLDTIIGDDFDRLIDGLEAKGMNDYNYHKVTKKFFKWHTNDDVPKWVRQVRLPHEETPVQSSDLLNEQHKPEPEDNQTEASSIDMEHSFYKPMVKHSPMQR